MFVLVATNYFHYDEAYKNLPEARKALSFWSVSSAADILLSLGRYTWNVFVPWGYAVLYSRASVLNLLGLGILVVAVGLIGKKLGQKTTALWLSLGALSLALVLLKIRSLFVSDTYALTFAFAIAFLLLQVSLRAAPAGKRFAGIFFPVLALYFVFVSRSEARLWVSNYALWERAYQYDGDCQTTMPYLMKLIESKQPEKAIPVIHRYWALDCPNQEYYGRFFRREIFELTLTAIYYDKSLTLAEKRQLMKRHDRENSDDLVKMFLFVLDVESGDYGAAQAKIEAVNKAQKDIFRHLEGWEIEVFLPSVQRFCERVTSASCLVMRPQMEERLKRLSAEQI
jgi:hypothetical protein